MKLLPKILPLVVAVIIGALVFVGSHGKARKSKDDLWAEALWKGLPPNGASSEQVSRLFVAAIDRAQRKAPIYVSFGDNASGALMMKEQFDALVAAVQTNIEETIEKGVAAHATQINPDLPDAATAALKVIVQESYGKALEGRQVESAMQELQRLTDAKGNASIACYVAAVAQDPQYLPAWYRLAAYADGERQTLAIRELQRRDPRNALAWYIAGARAAEADDLAAALAAVEQGNALPECRWYPSELPASFTLVLPMTPELAELGLAGRRLNATGLKQFVRAAEAQFAWADPLQKRLRTVLCRRILEEGRQLSAAGAHAEAVRRFAAIRDFGLHFVQSEPRDAGWVVHGLLQVQQGNEALRKAAEVTGNLEQQHAADELTKKLEAFHPLFSKAISRPELSPAETLATLAGERDLLAEDAQRLVAALKEAGFITETLAPRP